MGAGRRDALLIATGAYDDGRFHALRSPAQDCAGLAGVLSDPRIGGFRTDQVRDAPASRVMRAVDRFFMDRSRDDLLLLHVSCHGIKDDDGRLYFAARDTDRDLPASSAVPAAFLRDRMERCRARTVVVLLDCCYSGAFLHGAKAADDQVHLRDELGGHGRVVLTATSRTEYAWEGKRVESMTPQPSLFTGALIHGLRTGAADLNGDGRITVTELYDYVYESLHGAGVKQTPRMWADLEYQVTIARTARAENTRIPPMPRTPPAQDTFTAPPPRAPAGAGAGAVSGERPGPADAVSQVIGVKMGIPRSGSANAAQSGKTAGRPRRSRARRGSDALIRLELPLEETAFGVDREIQLDTAVVCSACSGEGTAPGTRPVECDTCGGRGETGTRRGFFSQAADSRVCRTCEGYGTVLPTPCPACHGEGRVRSRRTLTARIPAGVDNGTRIRFAGQGEAGPGGGEPADLYVEIVELPHPVFRRVGDDLHRTVTVSRALATTGGKLTVETLDGRKTVTLPQGFPDGRTLRLPSQGVTHLQGGGRGALLARVEIRG
ncbi:caspase, EACC1-associated type [Streptomyces sp. 142MFCol3.1]|uniref:caspase, EACC1-associated type n=1 Tax=Streptomyces sp. 142MFCol3.1 TaxID=1172179 RepID=UPI00042171B3